MAQIEPKDLPLIREKHCNQKIVYCSGVFDLIHPGHVLFFEDCKKFGDVLVVGVGGDTNLKKIKGNDRPIMNKYMRMKMVDSLKPVDYCFLSSHTPVNHPLEFIETVFKLLKPDTYIINADASEILYREEMAKKNNVGLKILPRWCPDEFENISTTKLIEKIKGGNRTF
ncbi:MAG: adenylyltransferase/cytidyltransferase family protein [Candidatus Liptonbacteria bacterium]|nr:adenylyltransferase/cytidyltransferase family protein [Candidatus Liptonbacteria bacterium]